MQSGASSTGAVHVLLVDAEQDPPALEASRPDGTRWAGVWLVVRAGGEPAGLVELAFDGRDVITADEVARAVAGVAHGASPRGLALPDIDLPAASVVVASDLARPEHLRACLTALLQLDYPDFEVIVVDNHRGPERDGLLADVVAGLDGVRTVREPVPGTSAARNAGARAARGEVIAFTDDDVRVDPGWLRAIGTRFALRPDEDLVTGLILPTDLETDAQLWFERHYGGFGGVRTFAPLTYRGAGRELSPGRRSQVTAHDWSGRELRTFAVYGAGIAGAGANMAFRAEALRRLGGFDLSLGPGTPARGGEDLVLFIAHLWNGGAIGYEPAAMVFHSHRAEYPALRQQLYNYGLGFTALLSALVLDDARHVLGVLSRVPAFVRASRSREQAVAGPAGPARLGPPVPAELSTLERRGSLRGPGAYAHSRL
jgi:glycosyltransferase involved in cell wall biosynthesis